MSKPGVLFCPYGTVLEERGREIGVSDLANPLKVLDDGAYARETLAVARGYARYCDVATTNTFGLRGELRRGNAELYREGMEAHHRLVVDALRGSSGNRALYIALGPYGIENHGCYNPDEAPADAYSSQAFHREQLAVVRDLQGVGLVLFETVCTAREAIGMALAAKSEGLPTAISFVVNKEGRLLSGETLSDTIKQVDAASRSHPSFYSVNCSPIEGVWSAFAASNGQRGRIAMAYPNASSRDPRELDEADGIVTDLAAEARAEELSQIANLNHHLHIVGGCCGFDHESVQILANGVRQRVSRLGSASQRPRPF